MDRSDMASTPAPAGSLLNNRGTALYITVINIPSPL
jgi:hypothetical protein